MPKYQAAEQARTVSPDAGLGRGRVVFAKIKWYSKDAMMRWTVETLDERVDAELTALPVDMRDRFVRIAGLLETFGPTQVREPYVKPLVGKLWEMRLKGKDGIARAAYVAAVGRRLVIVHVFIKKTQKTPRANLDIALGRAKEAGLI
jgi:phage-related protein